MDFDVLQKMLSTIAKITEEFGLNWHMFIAQLINVAILLGLFILAARVILKRGSGWEVPVWLVLSFFIPLVFPILALIHFRKPRES